MVFGIVLVAIRFAGPTVIAGLGVARLDTSGVETGFTVYAGVLTAALPVMAVLVLWTWPIRSDLDPLLSLTAALFLATLVTWVAAVEPSTRIVSSAWFALILGAIAEVAIGVFGFAMGRALPGPPEGAARDGFRLLVVGFPFATAYLGTRLRRSIRAPSREETRRLARDARDLLIYARRGHLDVKGAETLVRRANAAARRERFVRAIRLMARAKRDLMAALSFEETLEGDWVTAGPVPERGGELPPGAEFSVSSPAAPRVEAPPSSPASKARRREWAAKAGLAAAVELVDRSQETFEDDPILLVQRELQWARAALEDLKIHGRDRSGPIGKLKRADAFARKAQWDDALQCLRQLRREVSGP